MLPDFGLKGFLDIYHESKAAALHENLVLGSTVRMHVHGFSSQLMLGVAFDVSWWLPLGTTLALNLQCHHRPRHTYI
jgi:hypothetical protein